MSETTYCPFCFWVPAPHACEMTATHGEAKRGDLTMATKAPKAPTLSRANSHSVREDATSARFDGIGKEEVYLYYLTEWRGATVRVVMSCDRYRSSVWENDKPAGTRLGEWRVYAQRAETYDPAEPMRGGADLSDLARRRLSEELEPIARQWLASDAYIKSEELAYAHMILGDGHTYTDTVREMRRQCEQYRDKLPRGVRALLLTLAETIEIERRQRENLSARLQSIADEMRANA